MMGSTLPYYFRLVPDLSVSSYDTYFGGYVMYAHRFNRRSRAMVFSFSCTEGTATSAKHERHGQQKDEEMWYTVCYIYTLLHFWRPPDVPIHRTRVRYV
jgi:hypothetical protein